MSDERKDMLGDIISMNTKGTTMFFWDIGNNDVSLLKDKIPKEEFDKLTEGEKELVMYLITIFNQDKSYIRTLDLVKGVFQ